jgi:hypothetical protein
MTPDETGHPPKDEVHEEMNPYEPAMEITAGGAASDSLGIAYWGPMGLALIGLLVFGATTFQGGEVLFPMVFFVFAVIHGLRYQYRLSRLAHDGVLAPRIPDFAVFLLSCFLGFVIPTAASIAFFCVCMMGAIVMESSVGGSTSWYVSTSGWVIPFFLGGIAAAAVAVLGTRIFLPRKPKR